MNQSDNMIIKFANSKNTSDIRNEPGTRTPNTGTGRIGATPPPRK